MLALRRTLVSPRFALFVRTLVGVCLMACIGPLSAFAVNLNEAPGSPTNATFVGGPGGDSISAYSGDLELAVPIGPRWNLPGLSWGLSLNYSSKIWRLRSGLTIATELERRGAFGIGWRLTMGRVFQMCRYGCAGLNNLHYEDSNGTLHPIMIDPGTPGVPWELSGHTTDGTYMRVQATLRTGAPATPTISDITSFAIHAGDGTTLLFYAIPPDGTDHSADPDDFGGWRLEWMTRESPGPSSTVNMNARVHVAYEPGTSLGHCIQKIEDFVGNSVTPFRTMTFTNTATIGGATVEGGVTTAITVPAVDGNSPSTATYTLTYTGPTPVKLCDPTCDPNISHLEASDPNVILLSKVTFPQDSSISYSFAYDPNTGELTKQTLPTGATVEYTNASYSYLPEGLVGHSAVVREVTSKKLTVGSLVGIWNFKRYRWNTTGQAPIPWTEYTIVTDPAGNHTRYHFSSWFFDNAYVEGLTKETETYRQGTFNSNGDFTGGGTLLRQVVSGFGIYGTPDDPDIRPNGAATIYTDVTKASRIVNDTPLPYGHFGRTLEYGFDSTTIPATTTERAYEIPLNPYDPNTSQDPDVQNARERWLLWTTDNMIDEKVKDRDGSAIRHSSWTYRTDGRVTGERQFADPAAAGSSDIITANTYDPALNLLDTTTVAGGDGGNRYKTKMIYTGPHLTRKQIIDTSDVPLPYFSYDVDVDPFTGLVLTSRDSSTLATKFTYDRLGRPTSTTPPGGEQATSFAYVGLTQTTSVKGSGQDRIEATSALDALGRPTGSKRLDQDANSVLQFTCYDGMGRTTFSSEPHAPHNGETIATPPCSAVGSYDGTTYSYTSTENGVTADDPFGRIRKVTAADQSHIDTSYLGVDTTVSSFNINGDPASATGTSASSSYHRDAFGRLTYVESPAGADARYSYDDAGEMTRVELLGLDPNNHPFTQVRSFTYDLMGRLRFSDNPESGTVQVTKYDAAGNGVEKIESDGTRFMMAYDAAGRPTDVSSAHRRGDGSYAPSTLLAHYEYDNPNVTNGAGRLAVVYSYDEAGSLVAVKELSYEGRGGRLGHEAVRFTHLDGPKGDLIYEPKFFTCYSYTALGLLDSLRYPSTDSTCNATPADVTLLSYRYKYGFLRGVNDSRRNPAPSAADPTTWTLLNDVTYDASGGLAKVMLANTVVETITVDKLFRPAQIVVKKGTGGGAPTHLDTGTYSYDGTGNIRGIGPLDVFTYDLIGRLKSSEIGNKNDSSANGQTILKRGWTYDDFGNLSQISSTTDASAQVTFTIDQSSNRIKTGSGSPFKYDQRGNLSLDDSHSYLFDDRNRLLAVKMGQSYPVGEYGYDVGGMRFYKEEATGRRTFFIRDGGGNVLTEITPSEAGYGQGYWQKDYFYSLGHVIGQAEEKAPKPPAGMWSDTTTAAPYVTLHWSPNTESDLWNYRIYARDPNDTTSYNVVASPSKTATSWTDTSVVPSGSTRFYRVAAVAVSATGPESVTSRGLRVQPGATVSLAPQDLTAESTANSVTLRWSPVQEDQEAFVAEPATTFLGYNVYRWLQNQPPPTPLVALNPSPLRKPIFRDLGVTKDTSYVYMVQAVTTEYAMSAGAQTSATPTDSVRPATPLDVHASGGHDGGQVTISWSPNHETDLAGYRLYRWETLAGGGVGWVVRPITISPTATSTTDGGLPERVTYTYSVSAFDSTNNESAFSPSVSARPHVASPSSPYVLSAYTALGWYGASALLTYGGAGGDPSGYGQFRIYKKEEALPADRWELAFVDPVVHIPGDPNEQILPSNHFAGQFVDQWVDRCHITEFMVGGVDNTGEEVVDSDAYKVPRVLVPAVPVITAAKVSGNWKVSFAPQGFIGCQSFGNGFAEATWKLVEKRTGVTTPVEYSITNGITQISAPNTGETWAYAIKGTVLDLYENATYSTFMGEDVCIRSDGSVNPDDSSCDDLDLSRQVPPPTGPPSTWGGGQNAGPVRLDDGTWQLETMKLDIGHPHRAALEFPRGEGAELPAELDSVIATSGHSGPESVSTVRLGEPSMEGGNELRRPPFQAALALEAEAPSVRRANVSGLLSMGAPSHDQNPDPLGRPRALAEIWPSTSPVISTQDEGWDSLGHIHASASSDARWPVVDAGGLNVGLFLITGRAPKTFSWQFFTWDHLGSVRVITDVSGFEIAESRFLPYGDEIPTNTSPITDNTHRFTSHERDAESGGDYMRARYFTSRLASFLSPDPLPGTITSPHTLNSYSYVRRNPLNFLDRHGLSPNPAAPAPIIDTCVTCGAHRREQNDVPGLEPAGDSNDTLSPSQVTQLVKNGGGSIDTVLSDDFVNGTQEQRDEAYKEQAALKDGLTPGTKRFFFLLGVDIETELTPGNGVVIDLSKSSVNGPGQTTDAGEILLSEKRIHALDDPSKGFQATLLHEHAHLGALQRYGSITADSIVWPGLRDKIFRQVDSFAKTLHLWGDGYIGLAAEQIQYGRVELWNH